MSEEVVPSEGERLSRAASLARLPVDALLLLGLALYLRSHAQQCVAEASDRRRQPGSSHARHFYDQKRLLLPNARAARGWQLLAWLLYCWCLAMMGAPMGSNSQILTGALGYVFAAAAGWSAVSICAPHCEELMLDYQELLSCVATALSLVFLYLCESLGCVRKLSPVVSLLCYNTQVLLEDIPEAARLTLLAFAVVMSIINHAFAATSAGHLVGCAATCVAIGVVLPRALLSVLRASKPFLLPPVIFSWLSLASHGVLAVELLASTRGVVEPVQDQARQTGWAWLLPHLMAGEGAAAHYRYGLHPALGSGGAAVVLVMVVLCSLAMSVIDDEAAGDSKAALEQAASLPALASFMRSRIRQLRPEKKATLCGLLCVAVLQGAAIMNATLGLLLAGAQGLVATAPVALLTVLVGVLVQVTGMLYVLAPDGASPPPAQLHGRHDVADDGGNSDSDLRMVKKQSNQEQLYAAAGGMPAAAQVLPRAFKKSVSADHLNLLHPQPRRPTAFAPDAPVPASGMWSPELSHTAGPDLQESSGCWPAGAINGSSDQWLEITGEQANFEEEQREKEELQLRVESLTAFRARMESLAALVRGRDGQPAAFGLDEFIRGAAAAIKGVFPGVHHASFCLLSGGRRSVNVYTFVGDGAQLPPQINVAVAPGTMLSQVLSTCQPMFVPDVGCPSGGEDDNVPDVRFMRLVLGLRSVACLPLIVAKQRILGVLRLGFEEPRSWPDQERAIAEQLAMVLSSSSANLGRSAADPRGAATADSRAAAAALSRPGTTGDIYAGGYVGGAAGGIGRPPGSLDSGRTKGQGSEAGGYGDQWLLAQQQRPHQTARPQQQQQQQQHGKDDWQLQPQPAPLAVLQLQQQRGSGSGSGSGHSHRPVSAHSSRTELVRRDTNTSIVLPRSPRSPRPRPAASHSFSESSACSVGEGADPGAIATSDRSGAATPDIEMLEIVGRGGFGSVYKALWRGKLCAVKVLEHGEDFVGCTDAQLDLMSRRDAGGRRAAAMEGAISTTIKHPNVVQTFDFRVVNVDLIARGPRMPTKRLTQETHIIMEYCDRGSLQDAIAQNLFLSSHADGVVDMDLIVMTLAEVASAMDFLHRHMITHRDLKPKNVLLKSSNKDRRGFCTKVSDFGLSQMLPDTDRTMVSTKYSGTVTHMPPELIEEGKVYQQGDVYAFGIIMWEIYTGSVPYAHMAHPQILVAVVTHNLRPKFPDRTPDWYKSLAAKCWRKDPKARPSFEEIAEYLTSGAMISERGWRAVGDMA